MRIIETKYSVMFLILIVVPQVALSSVEVGTGINSSFSGRFVPSLSLAYSSENLVVSAYSSGTKNDYYYHSTYGIHMFNMIKIGDLLSGEVRFGYGAGLLYSKRGFSDLNSVEIAEKDDFVIGPAFRVNWSFFSPLFLNVDATYGIKDLDRHLFLNFQDSIVTTIGIRI